MVVMDILEVGKAAKAASAALAAADSATKNKALELMAAELINHTDEILAANAIDMAAAKEKGMTVAFQDRLLLTEARVKDMADGLLALKALPDPIGEVEKSWDAAQGIHIEKVRVPLGVIGIIYEARPNVTADGAGICLKTGNAVILRGGSDAINSNLAVGALLAKGAAAAGLPAESVQVVADTSRDTATKLMQMNEYLNLLIPRGGAGLIQSVVKNATVPVIETGVGNCHIFVDATADVEMAKNILINAKTQRPAVCNAAEGLLIAEENAAEVLPVLAAALKEAGVEIRGCEKVQAILGADCVPATEEDFYKEYGALIISCKVVKDVQEAIEHINKYGSRHSECIVSRDEANIKLFQALVDAAAVYANVSTRFTDGFQYGFGAEIGISTQKMHARGPMGLYEMTSYKYVISGEGQCRK